MKLEWQRFDDDGRMAWVAKIDGNQYHIVRWWARDRCGRHRQYAVTRNGEPLHREPLYDWGGNNPLADAKRLAQDDADRQRLGITGAGH